MSRHKEFWIIEGRGYKVFLSETDANAEVEKQVAIFGKEERPHKIHVIEYRSYEELKKEYEEGVILVPEVFQKDIDHWRRKYVAEQAKAEALAAALIAVMVEVKCGPESSYEDVAYYIAEEALAEYRGLK